MNKELSFYKETTTDIFNKIINDNPQLEDAAKVIAREIGRGGLIHVIGPGGHSNMAAEEVLWRAGGLVPINAILDAGTNLIHGAKRSNYVERTVGYAKQILDSYQIGKTPKEVIVIVNAYGINPMTIDTVLEAKKRDMISIGITSNSFAQKLSLDHPSRHPSGKNLFEEADYFINCHLPYGDAVVEIDGLDQKTGPTATLCNVFAINALMIEAVKQMVKMNIAPPLWMSANLPGGDEANKEYEQEYMPRIKHL
ncbi:MAG: sugar isomerase domain-containing protein [Sphaerochaetaceae bacterium]|nr:sugar isomerase domain-containing protein [Sphaerochaetaceae bacterium]